MKTFERDRFLIILSAPSGGGKTSICRAILESMPDITYSVSYTTRKPRTGEINGKSYFFVSEENFLEKIAANDFLEFARVHGNMYGTSRSYVIEQFNIGSDVIMDIDVQGAEIISRSDIDHISIFLLPPDMEVLRERLIKRGQDDKEAISLRLENAAEEIVKMSDYDYLVINDELDRAIMRVRSIIIAERNRFRRYKNIPTKLYGGRK